MLADDELYVYHCKSNIKTAIDGTVWLWHQDYGYWQHDGVPTSNMATFLVMLDEATELGGCLYLVPGSHKAGVLPAYKDETTTSYPQWTIENEPLRAFLRANPRRCRSPAGRAPRSCSTATSSTARATTSARTTAGTSTWRTTRSANRPNPVPAAPRPDYVVSRNYAPLALLADDDLREPAAVSG